MILDPYFFYPMLAIRWLTYLAGAGFSPAGIIDLARPHTPFFLFSSPHIAMMEIAVWQFTLNYSHNWQPDSRPSSIASV